MPFHIKDRRVELEMSQEELAKKSGVSRTIISGLENGIIKSTTTNTVLALANALDTTVDKIFCP